jgi:predicted ATPase
MTVTAITFTNTNAQKPIWLVFLRLSWAHKIGEGCFRRAESFYNFATYLNNMQADNFIKFRVYGGKLLQEQSHG